MPPCRPPRSRAPRCQGSQCGKAAGMLGYSLGDVDPVAARQAAQNDLSRTSQPPRTDQNPYMAVGGSTRGRIEQIRAGPHPLLYFPQQHRESHGGKSCPSAGQDHCSPEGERTFAHERGRDSERFRVRRLHSRKNGFRCLVTIPSMTREIANRITALGPVERPAMLSRALLPRIEVKVQNYVPHIIDTLRGSLRFSSGRGVIDMPRQLHDSVMHFYPDG